MRLDCKYDKFNKETIDSFVNEILGLYKTSNKKEIVIVNIGTDKLIADSIAPMVGTILQRRNLNFKVYGTLKNPVHALNVNKTSEEVRYKHPEAFVIAIDACIGDEDNIGTISIADKPIKPGSGVGKQLNPVGDMNIKLTVDSTGGMDLFMNKNIRLSFIYEAAQVISDILIHTNNKVNDDTYEIKEEVAAGF